MRLRRLTRKRKAEHLARLLLALEQEAGGVRVPRPRRAERVSLGTARL